MKVGILSMQRIKNYGSFLQAFALKSIVEELGGDVQFVDYHPGETLIPPDGGTGIKRKLSKGLDALKGGAPLSEKIRFINYKKNYAENYYPYLGITDEMNYAPKLDVLVVGSDEVFNCVQNNTNVGFTPELFGQNSNADIVISYAASFGNTTLEKLKKYGVDQKVAGWLQNFDALSVRDENSARTVEALTKITPESNLDPVLMYNFTSSGKIPASVNEDKYMLLYGYSNRFSAEECKEIRKFAKKKGLKIFCIGGVQDCCDKFIDTDPFSVIAYFQHAEYVVTDTFHGTIMSTITHRPFASVVRSAGYGNSEKLTDLLKKLKLEKRILGNMTELEELLQKDLNFTATDLILKNERARTREYLKKWVY